MFGHQVRLSATRKQKLQTLLGIYSSLLLQNTWESIFQCQDISFQKLS